MSKARMVDVGQASVAVAVACLRGGGVAVLPTDTVYGLAVSPQDDAAIERVYRIKGRPRDRNLPIMVADERDLEMIGVVPSASAMRLLRSNLMPGPLTLALGVDAERAPGWLAGREEVAIRIPDSSFMLAILREVGPLLVTSANVHGLPTQGRVTDIAGQLAEQPDLLVDGGVLDTVPSTLVNCRLDPPIVERVGAVPVSRILELLG